MHLSSPCLPQQSDYLGSGGAANNTIINQYHPLTGQNLRQGVKLQLNAEVPDALVGLNEGTPDITVLNQSFTQRYPGPDGITDASRGSRIGNAHHQVGIYRVLLSQTGPHRLARLVKQPAVNHAVGTGKVDILEDTEPPPIRYYGMTIDTAGVNRDYLTRFNLFFNTGPDVVESTAL